MNSKASPVANTADAEKTPGVITTPDNASNNDDHKVDEHVYPSAGQLRLMIPGLIIVMFLCMLDVSIIGTAIPQITSDFNRLADVGWYVGAYQLASATIQPMAGKLYLHFSTKVMHCSIRLAGRKSDLVVVIRA
jgi:hypothetical protein